MRRNPAPVSPIFRNERDHFEKAINRLLSTKTTLPAGQVHRIVACEMTRRPVHILLMRPANERVSMLMESICPAIWRAERKAGLR